MPLSSRYLFEDFVEQASKARTLEALFALLQAVVASYGFDQINFSIIRDLEIPIEYWGFGQFSTYSAEWLRFYSERRYELYDPVLERAASSRRPFWWQELGRDVALTPHQREIMNQAADANLHHGFGVPLIGPGEQLAGVALATSIKNAVPRRNPAVLAAICNHFYDCVKNLVGTELPIAPNRKLLSPRLYETLVYVSQGRTDAQIAGIMRIGEDTVNGYLRRIFEKLDVNNRRAAVFAARRRGILPPW